MCSPDGSAPCSFSFNFRAARSKHGEGNKKAMLGVTPGSFWLSLCSSGEQSCRRRGRNTKRELAEGNDQLWGKHWQLPGPDSVPDRKPVTWKCLATIMNGRAGVLSLRSSPCPALAEVSTGTDLCASYHETIPKSSQRPHPVEVSCLGWCQAGSKGTEPACRLCRCSPARCNCSDPCCPY